MATKNVDSNSVRDNKVMRTLIPTAVVSLFVIGGLYIASRSLVEPHQFYNTEGLGVVTSDDSELKLIGGYAWDEEMTF